METLLQNLINGLTIGSFYALVALGYSMVYGVMKLINFAHGDLFTLGSYFAYSLLVWSSGYVTNTFGAWGGMICAIIFAAIGTAAAGLLMERVAYRPVMPAGRLPLVVSALGVSIVIQNGIMAIWGPRYQTFPASTVPGSIITFAGLHITSLQLFILILSVILMLLIYFFVERTMLGAAVRAAALDRDTAALMGINFRAVILLIFTLGPALGGLAGVMNGMYYRTISFNMGWTYGLKSFTATILGGIGNIPGAMIGGLLLGILESTIACYVSSAWKDIFVFFILILVLIWRPTGLIGEKAAEKV